MMIPRHQQNYHHHTSSITLLQLFGGVAENDIPYHPPTGEAFDGEVEVDIPYHGPPVGDQDSLLSDELSIPDWTTPLPPPPQPTKSIVSRMIKD